ncbi:MAG TPA: DUF4118 domain-containing protein [Anaerolineales bacterium]|nr:DUF4118 domain-containing protein [Anaerolineales bacterium]
MKHLLKERFSALLTRLKDPAQWLNGRRLRRFLGSIALVLLVTLIGLPLEIFLHPTNLVMLYLAAVVVTALYLGRSAAILASVLSVLAFDYVFVAPRFTLNVSDTEYLVTFLGLLVVGLVISNTTAVVSEQFQAAEQRERNATALNLLSRDLTVAVGLDEMLQAVLHHVGQTFKREVVVWLPQNNHLIVQAASPGFRVDDAEQNTAAWAYAHNQPAGRGTEMLSHARGRYLPLETARGVLGVLGIEPLDETTLLTTEQRQLLDSFARLAAMAIERAHLAEQASQALVLRQTEKLQSALLNSISHDLRTPLASITGILSTLRESESGLPGEQEPGSWPANSLDPATRAELLESASEEAARLNRLVGNLLDMTRLEGGALRLSIDRCDVRDLVGAALAQLGDRLNQHPLRTAIPQELPLVPMDFVLMVQVLSNLLDNAAKYSPEGAPIEVTAQIVEQHSKLAGPAVEMAVFDRGMGIPSADLKHVFEKFYRVHRPDGVQGTGLGLSISRGIVEAHGGRIWASQREAGGSIIALALPLHASSPLQETSKND